MLCKGYPNEFCTYVTYVKNLKFDEKPNYDMLRGLFKQMMKNANIEYDYIYDWTKDSEK